MNDLLQQLIDVKVDHARLSIEGLLRKELAVAEKELDALQHLKKMPPCRELVYISELLSINRQLERREDRTKVVSLVLRMVENCPTLRRHPRFLACLKKKCLEMPELPAAARLYKALWGVDDEWLAATQVDLEKGEVVDAPVVAPPLESSSDPDVDWDSEAFA